MIQNIPSKFKPMACYKPQSNQGPIEDGNLIFVAKQPSNIVLSSIGSPDAITLQYSKNDASWSTYSIGDQIDLTAGQFVKFSGNNDHISKDSDNYYQFVMTGSIAASGNIQSLMNFSDTVSSYSYYNMFSGCSNLINAPQLPATGLADWCYYSMFRNCTSLSSAPQLPATTLALNCYRMMFNGCSSLPDAPYLPATTLAAWCYLGMFIGCSNLSSVHVEFTNWGGGCGDWLNGVASNGTFTCPAGLDTTIRDVDHVPQNWTIINN